MGDVMKFPERIEDFIDDYSFRDDERTYTNGSMLIPVFRVNQAIEHYMPKWIPCSEKFPENDNYILMSFDNYSLPLVGRYVKDGEMGGSFYVGDCDGDDTCTANDLFVNAWQPLPEQYKPNGEEIPERKERMMQTFLGGIE